MIARIFYIKNVYLWFLCWLGFVLSYGVSIKYDFYMRQWQDAIYIVQFFADVMIGCFSFLTFRSRLIFAEKKFYFLIFLSLIPGILTNEIYNLIINIIGVNSITAEVDLHWAISYFLFLIVQALAWSYLLVHYNNLSMECFKKNVIILYVQPIIVVTLSFVAVILFGGSVFSRMNSLGIINSSLEAILFILISACLSRTKNNSLVTLETGFLLLIAFNLMHRFSYLTGHYTKIFDAVWILSLMIIFLGLGKAHAKRNKEIEFFSIDSIHSITSAIFVSFATFLFTLFIMIDFAISSVELGTFEAANVLPQNIPVILIFSYILTLLISRVVANFVKKPLDYLYKKINMVYKGGCENLIYSNKKLDVFEINELEKFTLHTLEQLQAANRIKADFLMNMSHDFRTPASGIYQMAGYVYKKLEKTELSSYMKLIVDSSGQLINLLDDVLDYSRLDNGKWELSFEKFDLAEVIRDVVLCLSAKAKEKSLKINSHFCSESFYYVGDKLAINRVILNLISNAIKFTDMGSVSVMLKKQVINNKSWVLVEIEDTGIGIAPQYHRVIFEPFIRIASAENAKYPGIGLGLSNASLVVEKMQGKITIRSALNVGSTFSIYLPLGRENDEKIP